MGNLCSQPKDENTRSHSSLSFRREYRGVTFENINSDICDENVDVIVSSANNRLAHHNGLANSIVVKGGAIIQEESDRIVEENDGPLSAGTVVITCGGQLNVRYVVHLVCPVWTGGEKKEIEKLGEAILNAFTKAEEVKAASIALPSLASGMFGFPKDVAANIIVKKSLEYFQYRNFESSIKLVKFVNLDVETVKCFRSELENNLRSSYQPFEGPIMLDRGSTSAEKRNLETKTTEENNPSRENLDNPMPRLNILSVLESRSAEKLRNSSPKMEPNSYEVSESPNNGILVLEESVPLDQSPSMTVDESRG